jgi:hypothetical protein
MKKAILFFMLVATFFVAYSTSHSTGEPAVKASEIFLPIGKSGQMISVRELSVIKVNELEALTGNKMRLMDKIGFSIGQKQLRKSINRDGTFNKKKVEKFFSRYADGTTGFHAGGFFLGFLLGLIGVLIAYLIKDDKKKNRVKWAWLGLLISIPISILLFVA